MARCRGCSAEIDFVTLRSGRKMPVESAEVEEYRVWLDPPMGRVPTIPPPPEDGSPGPLIEHRRLLLVTEDGDVLTVWTAAVVEDGGKRKTIVGGPALVRGRESHFASCPAADQFRR